MKLKGNLMIEQLLLQ